MAITTREKIDEILKQNATLESNLGIDSTPEERKQTKYKQFGLFNIIKILDREFYNIICP